MQIILIKGRFMFLLALLFVTASFTPGWAQEDAFKNIQQQFTKSDQQAGNEKVYVHTDKDFYLAGEIIWFKVYCVDGALHRSLNLSKVAYVEILDRSQKPVAQAKIALTQKGGSGSFYLPLTLNSDSYTMRAYTNWMKNSGASSFFKKAISIVNTIKPPIENAAQDSIRVIANFFPEGGNLVAGIETKVAFHIADQNGKGIDARGIITNDLGDTVQNFSPGRFGIGNFTFKPLASHTYKATILLSGGKYFTTLMPAVYDFGYVMNVTDNKDGRFRITVKAKAKEPGQRGEAVFLLTHTRQVLKVSQAGYINYENDLVLFVDKAKLDEGISHFTLFDQAQRPVCERLVFTRPVAKNPTTLNIDKTTYEKRGKVTLSVASGLGDQLTDSSNYSVAVFQIDSLQSFTEDDLRSWLLLSSDLNGQVESPGYYFSKEQNVDAATDNLLMTHGWRRFRWQNILSSSSPVFPKFIPEYGGHLITARVTSNREGKVASNIDCFLSFPGSPYGFYVSRTDDKGMVYFDVNDYYGPGEIIIQAGRDANAYRVDVLTPFTDESEPLRLRYLPLIQSEAKKLAAKSIAMQVQNIYIVDSIRRFHPPAVRDTFPFFGKSEYAYRLDDYKRFITMEEVLREYVTPINVVLRNGKLYMSMYDEILQSIYTDKLLVLLDGVPLMDYNKIFSYDPLKVKRLDVVPRKYQFGEANFNGIASFETYLGKFDGFDLIPGVIAIDYEGLQLQREFYSPVYENDMERQKRIPDFRSTLYWTPDVQIDKAGKGIVEFYTSDKPGKFLIVLQGFNEKNEPVSTTTSFTVE